MQQFQTNIVFHCPSCGQSSGIEVQVPELNFMSDKMSEHVSEGEVYISCPNCKANFDGYAYCTGHECTISIEEHDLEIHGDPPMYSPTDDYNWGEYDIPDDPHGIFLSTHDQMLELLDIEFVLAHDDQIVARMIFAQLISAMEAYLADTLMSQVLGDPNKTKALLAKDTELNKQNFSLKDIAGDEGIVERHVQGYLRRILYHNLGKVQFLYDAALGVELKTSNDDWQHLHKSVLHRHDCVHRNGFDSEGTKNTVFNKDYVRETATVVKRLVDKVDGDLSPF
ncbi:hypothetical protein [Actibacterium sp. D379-3]